MADPNPSSPSKWLWIAVLVLLVVLALIFVFSPSGERDGDVEDPILTEEFGEPAAGDMQGQDTLEQAPEPFAPGGDPE